MTRSVPENSARLSGRKVLFRLARFARPHRTLILVAFALLVGKTAMALAKPWPLKFALDDILTKPALEGDVITLLAMVLGLLIAVAVLEGLFTYGQAVAINRAGRSVIFELRAALFDQIQRLSLQFHSRRRTGDLMARVTGDVKSLKGLLTDSALVIVASALHLLGMSALLLWFDWKLALIPLLTTPFMAILIRHYTLEIREFSREERASEGALASVLHESLGTVRLTRVFNREDHARRRFLREAAQSLDSGLAATLAEQRTAWGIDALWSLVTAAVLGFGIARVLSGNATAGELVVFVHYVKNFYKPIRAMLKHANKVTRAVPRAERVIEILDSRSGVEDLPGAVAAGRMKGRIEFRGVKFGYDDHDVLQDINVVIPAGSVTAIVGPTGSGKTTLASLIPRLYDVREGAVLLDGRDVREYTLSSVRSQIGMVLQESILLRASIAENIAYGRSKASMAEIVAAARAANAHEFIAKMKDGYDTEVGERGDTLSGGQRQRIAIARAMIGGAPILILDEPLTGLDASSGRAVLDALEKLMEDRTVVVITHQLDTVRNADQIVVMDGGRALQIGRYEELVKSEGKFRELVQRQKGGFLAARK